MPTPKEFKRVYAPTPRDGAPIPKPVSPDAPPAPLTPRQILEAMGRSLVPAKTLRPDLQIVEPEPVLEPEPEESAADIEFRATGEARWQRRAAAGKGKALEQIARRFAKNS